MKRRFLIFLVAIALLLGSCNETLGIKSPVMSETNTPTSIPDFQQPTNTVERSMIIPEDGKIWIWPGGDAAYNFVIDLSSNRTMKVNTDDGCTTTIGNPNWIYCRDSAGNIYLLDPTSRKQIDIISSPIWFSSTNNGEFLYFEYLDDTTGLFSITHYNVSTGKFTEIAHTETEYSARNWDSLPILSEDGERLIVTKTSATGERGLYEIIRGNLTYSIIDSLPGNVTWNIVWSPVEQSFIYGSIDTISEIGLNISSLYFVDLQNNIHEIVGKSPNGQYYSEFYGLPIFSPNGRSIVVSLKRELCIIQIAKETQNCKNVVEDDFFIAQPRWSPSGEFIAFFKRLRMNSSVASLMIYSVNTGEVIEFLENVDGIWLEWYPN